MASNSACEMIEVLDLVEFSNCEPGDLLCSDDLTEVDCDVRIPFYRGATKYYLPGFDTVV
jgi:hypothetical protein